MKVILIEDVQNLGSVGDVIQVKEGYARNYLFPKNLARHATDSNLKMIEEIKKRKIFALEKEKKEAGQLKEKLSLVSCTIPVEAGDDDRLFGRITAQDIAKAFEEEGISIDKRKIVVEEDIKKLGVYHVSIKLHPEVIGEVKVWVVKK
ncbi:MAG: 50S ribosomal protein L9 [Candidatus Omnitrophica bacterium]|nr:50S ribosomal protein L9 [Candidatus Omnitrophota bacterium]MBU1853647.1 50S ribosomal protein L9 [Candidatus Omnitrophota bacterium]